MDLEYSPQKIEQPITIFEDITPQSYAEIVAKLEEIKDSRQRLQAAGSVLVKPTLAEAVVQELLEKEFLTKQLDVYKDIIAEPFLWSIVVLYQSLLDLDTESDFERKDDIINFLLKNKDSLLKTASALHDDHARPHLVTKNYATEQDVTNHLTEISKVLPGDIEKFKEDPTTATFLNKYIDVYNLLVDTLKALEQNY